MSGHTHQMTQPNDTNILLRGQGGQAIQDNIVLRNVDRNSYYCYDACRN